MHEGELHPDFDRAGRVEDGPGRRVVAVEQYPHESLLVRRGAPPSTARSV